MNAFAVTWKRLAENQLAGAWLAAPDRNAVTRAQATIDRLLGANPLEYGRYL
jgi:hypothetical protein